MPEGMMTQPSMNRPILAPHDLIQGAKKNIEFFREELKEQQIAAETIHMRTRELEAMIEATDALIRSLVGESPDKAPSMDQTMTRPVQRSADYT